MALLWRQTCHEDLRRACRIKICVCIVLQETARSSWFDKTTNRSRNNSTTCGNKKSKPRGCGREWIRLKDIIIVYCVNTSPCILNSALNILLFTKNRGIYLVTILPVFQNDTSCKMLLLKKKWVWYRSMKINTQMEQRLLCVDSGKDSFWHRGKGKLENGTYYKELQDSLHFRQSWG